MNCLYPTERQKIFDILMKNNASVKETNNDGESIMFFVARAHGK